MSVNDVADGCELVCNMPGIFWYVGQSLMRHAVHCVEA
jgi:hypothetical protein